MSPAIKKPFDALSPREVNDLVLDKWGISLFKFAQVYAISPIDKAIQKSTKPFSLGEITEIKNDLRKMREEVFKRVRSIEKLMNRAKDLPDNDLSDDKLAKTKGLEEFINKYLVPNEKIIYYFERTCQLRKRGIGLSKKSIIAVGWGNLISKSGHRINWSTLADLYSWLWERINPYECYREWEPMDGIEDSLKIQYHRYRWAGSLDDYVFDRLNLDELNKDFWQIWFNLVFLKLGNGKFRESEVPRILLNIFTDWFLAGNEGLTIFSPTGSAADPFFLDLCFWLKNAGKALPASSNKWIGYPEKIVPKDLESTYESPEIGVFYRYAADIYLSKAANFNYPTPMIIFPDRSYFSSSL